MEKGLIAAVLTSAPTATFALKAETKLTGQRPRHPRRRCLRGLPRSLPVSFRRRSPHPARLPRKICTESRNTPPPLQTTEASTEASISNLAAGSPSRYRCMQSDSSRQKRSRAWATKREASCKTQNNAYHTKTCGTRSGVASSRERKGGTYIKGKRICE